MRETNVQDPLKPETGGQKAPVIQETLQDFIYRRFFKAGVVTVLSVGCLWGAINLLQIGLRARFLQLGLVPAIHAHAHAMIFGWIGLFVMGFAYQSFPRFKYASLWRPELANLSFYLMLGGIAGHVTAEMILPAAAGLVLGGLAAAMEFAAIALFVLVMRKSMQSAIAPRQPYEKYLYAAMFWFLVQALLDDVFFFAKAAAASESQLIRRIATIDGPLRDIQLLGFAAFMIAGVSLRMLPMAYGLKPPKKNRERTIFWLMNGSLVLDVASYVPMITLRNHYFAIALELAYILMAVWPFLLIRQLGLFGHPSQSDRSLKFFRAAYAWLAFAMLMLPFFVLYNMLTHQPFAHSYLGSHRHAFTVGFVSMMILGMSSRIVPMMAGVDVKRLSTLWGPFLLLNCGNVARISLQLLTDFVPGIAYKLVGFTGFIEVIALLWWGVELWRTMNLAKSSRAQLYRVPANAMAR
jgi:hypothetical protein